MKNNSINRRKAAQLTDQKINRGEGGETHQIGDSDVPILTTKQGIPIADDQNSLRIGARGPAMLEDAERTAFFLA